MPIHPIPSGSLKPVLAWPGEYNLRLGIVKELQPELVATHQGDARVLEGHAFVVEAAVSVGGRDIKPGINVYRFANRIPLLFEVRARTGPCRASRLVAAQVMGMPSFAAGLIRGLARAAMAPAAPFVTMCLWKGWLQCFDYDPRSNLIAAEDTGGVTLHMCMRQGGSDVITKTALKRINWGNYKIAQNTDKVGVFVSIVSTRIPYKGAGKEYIGGTACLPLPLCICKRAACYDQVPVHVCSAEVLQIGSLGWQQPLNCCSGRHGGAGARREARPAAVLPAGEARPVHCPHPSLCMAGHAVLTCQTI